MKKPLRVGIAGAGSISLGTAAFLSKNGFTPTIWSPSGKGTKGLERGIIVKGVLDFKFDCKIAKSSKDLIDNNDIIIIAIPGYGHKVVMDEISLYINQHQHIIISSHLSLGAIYLNKLLHKKNIKIPITAWGSTIVTGRRIKENIIKINTIRESIDLCTVPDYSSNFALDVCHKLFGKRFKTRDGLLAISLSNLNPQNHLGIALGNITRMEHGEVWSQGQNVTPKIGSLLEKLDLERLMIAKELGVKVKTIFDHFHLSFHIPKASIYEMNQNMHKRGNGGIGPNTAESRYVIEDIPYGVQFTILLGRLVNKPAILHESGMAIFSAMYNRNFSKENKLLNALNPKSLNIQNLQHASRTGMLQ